MEMDERTMIDLNAIPLLVLLPVSLAGGFALGLAYFRVLQISADLLVRGQRPLLALALTLGGSPLSVPDCMAPCWPEVSSCWRPSPGCSAPSR
jgi:hypothetical protein